MKYVKLLSIIGFITFSFSCKKEDTNAGKNKDPTNPISINNCSNENNNISETVDCSVQLSISSVFSETESNDKRILVVNNIPSHLVGQFPNKANPHSITAKDETLEVIALNIFS